MTSIDSILEQILALPVDWHGSGSFRPEVLRAIARHLTSTPVIESAETGTGKSTLLFSHWGQHHTVFAKDDRGDGDSLDRVRASSLLATERVSFVVGPTQRTLPAHQFERALDAVLIDGPHGYPFPELEYFYFYPHLAAGGLLILDDIDIPTVYRLFEFLREDAMFELSEVVQTTAFFRRTPVPVFDPLGDGWWMQNFNKQRFPISNDTVRLSWMDRARRRIPAPIKRALRRMVRRGAGSVDPRAPNS